MKLLLLLIIFPVFLVSCNSSKHQTTHLAHAMMNQLVELPRPNSGTYSFEEADLHRHEIFSNKPTLQIYDWLKPEYGAGFSIHINSNDKIEVSNFDNTLFTGDLDFSHVSISDLKRVIEATNLYNSPATISVTSETKLIDSKIFSEVIDLIYKPSIQILYVQN